MTQVLATSKRLSRGFHRLGLVLAAIPLLIGVITMGFIGGDIVRKYRDAQCAHAYATQAESRRDWHSVFAPDDESINLKQIGCSDSEYETLTYGMARNLSLLSEAQPLAIGLAITLAGSLSLYCLVRTIGWVIGGFASA